MKRLGLCASQAGLKLLEPLLQAGELEAIAVPAGLLNPQRPELIRHAEGPKGLLQEHWGELELLVGALAAGALVRLVAPLLQHKLHDPAVLLLMQRSAVPLVVRVSGKSLASSQSFRAGCPAALSRLSGSWRAARCISSSQLPLPRRQPQASPKASRAGSP